MPAATPTQNKGWYQYTTDIGSIRLIFLDHTTAGDCGFVPVVVGNLTAPIIESQTKRFRPRYVYGGVIGSPRYKFPIGNPTLWATLQGTGVVTVGGVNFIIYSFHGEKRYMPQIVDSTPEASP